MNISIIQTDLYWELPSKNREMFDEKISTLENNVDLIVLPEMFSTGFSMLPENLAEKWPGPTVKWMQRVATSKKVALAGSLIVEDSGKYYNRLVFVHPDGRIEHYDKRHLFRMAEEHNQYHPGDKRIVINYKGFRILLLVCYDLRFPVWSRNRNDYDMILIVANFPEKRSAVWNTLLSARAIENLCYVVACNRVGKDGGGFSYSGDSQIIDPKGKTITLANRNENQIISANIDLQEVINFRNSFPAHLDADEFEIK
ncbi:MAG: amidohydrolase [Bacteroidales bacterium]|nr:MAG: amidohydrolase [Bacteroidales bacterium]